MNSQHKSWHDYINVREYMSRNVTEEKEGHFIIIKRSIHQDDTKILNVHLPNNRASKCIK